MSPRAATRRWVGPSTRQQEWLLQAAILKGPAAVGAWELWKAAVDLETLDPASYRLLPLLCHNLACQGAGGSWLPRLRGVWRHAWFANQVLFDRLRPVRLELRQAGIDVLVLKGTALALSYYENLGLRPMEDVDVLVRPEHGSEAAGVLLRLGWVSELRWPERFLLVNPGTPFRNAEGQQIDLHAHVFPGALDSRAEQELWERRVPVGPTREGLETLEPTDQLLHVLVHGAQWDPVPAIRWMADAMAVLGRAEAAIDWGRLVAQAERQGRLLVLRDTLEELVRLLEAPVPGVVLQRLRDRRPGLAERIEHRLYTRRPPLFVGRQLRKVFDYVRWRRAGGPERGGLLDYVRDGWDLERAGQIPGQIVRRGLRRAGRDLAELSRRPGWTRGP